MAIGYFLRVGDRTTCGGHILTGDNTFLFYGMSAAREGDMITCGKHSGTYQILGGISNVWGNGRRMAGTLDSFSSCPCKSRMIDTINDSYAKEEQPAPKMVAAPIQQPEQAFTQPELGNDVIAIYKLREDIKNAFFLDKQSGEVTMVVTEPEKITNVKQILTDDCHRYIVFTNDGIDHSYFECPAPKNSNEILKVNKDGDIIQ